MVTATYLKNDTTEEEQFVADPVPTDLAANLPPGYSLVTHDISQEDYDNLMNPDYENHKIYAYVDVQLKNKPVETINFKKELNTRFHEAKEYKFGRLLRTTFYPLDGNDDPILTDPILKEDFDYIFDDKHLVEKVKSQLSYWRNSGTVDLKKTFFLPGGGMSEEFDRKFCIICAMKQDIVTVLMAEGDTLADANSDLDAFIVANQSDIDAMVNRGVTTFIDNITADSSDPFLQQQLSTEGNQLMKNYILDRIDYPTAEGGSPTPTTLGNLYKGSAL